MRTSMILTGLVVSAAVAAGCGEAAPQEQAAKGPAVTLAEREAQLEQDPYDLACADLADKVASARMTRRVQFALADDARIPGHEPAARVAEHLFRHHGDLQGQAGVVQARAAGHRGRAQRRVRGRPRLALIGCRVPE